MLNRFLKLTGVAARTIFLVIVGASVLMTPGPLNADVVGERSTVIVVQAGRLSGGLIQHIVSVTDKVLCAGEVRFAGGTFVGLWFTYDWFAPCSERFLPPEAVTFLGSFQASYGYNYFYLVGDDGGAVGEYIKTGRVFVNELCTGDYQSLCDIDFTGQRPSINLHEGLTENPLGG
jgi:hypothetical protein